MPFWSRKPTIDDAAWSRLVDRLPLLAQLDGAARDEVRALAEQFLRDKDIEGCGGLELDDTMRLTIAAQACVPIQKLGLAAYREVRSVLVYPDEFRSKWSFEDEMGIVTEEDRSLSGEAWSDGAIVLSWRDVLESGHRESGYNVVIHEFAHAIDMLTGEEDGVPPLPREIDAADWSLDFAAAREELARWADEFGDGDDVDESEFGPAVDPYAAESPAEGFAVFSEVYFETPDVLAEAYPAVFARLRAFYRV